MTAVVENLRRLTGRPSDVVERVAGLSQAVEAARGRLDPQLVDDAGALVERVGDRLRLSSEHTVVALAGATGSGKSSLFNAMCGLELAAVGVKRPTTSSALACSWGPARAHELLDWLGIPRRHQVTRMGLLDETAAARHLEGLVLIDLPDHDSTEVSHHLEVARLVKLVDVLVWVLDPQKYADAAIHDRFLKPLSSHAEVMMVTLNHVDEIPERDIDACIGDVNRLLVLDGLEGVTVIGTSAKRGDGLDTLHEALAQRLSDKKFARERLTADIKAMAARVAEQTGDSQPGEVHVTVRGELLAACAEAAGIPVFVEAVESASLTRALRATGWPLASWLARFRRDPMRRLLPTGSGSGESLSAVELRRVRSAIPAPDSVQRMRIDSVVRSIADEVTEGMAGPWEAAVRSASKSRLDDFAHALGGAVSETDLGVARNPRWWGGVRLLQWILFLIAVAGGLWLAALGALRYLQVSGSSTVDVGRFPMPMLMLVGGVVAGVAIALMCRAAVRVSARHLAQRADDRLRAGIEQVTDELLVTPMQTEVDAYVRCRDGVRTALAR